MQFSGFFLLIFCFSLFKYTYYYNFRSHISLEVAKLANRQGFQYLFPPLYITIPPYLKPASDRVVPAPGLWTYSFISYHWTYPTASLVSASTMMPSDRNSLSPYSSFLLNLLYGAFAACNHVVTARI